MLPVHRLAVDPLGRPSPHRRGIPARALMIAIAVVLAMAAAPVAAQERLHEGRALTQWVADLGAADDAVRLRAAAALSAFGADALAPLAQVTLSDPDPEVRLEAIKALARLGPVAQPAVPALAKAMQDRIAFVRRGAATAIGAVGAAPPEALEALMNGLIDPDPKVIDNAGHSLLALGAPALAPLTQGLKDRDEGMRQMSVLALSAGIRFGKLGPIPPETVTALIETLSDASSDIRDEAARALADLGSQAKGALPALRKMADSDPVGSVRLVALRAIDRIESSQ